MPAIFASWWKVADNEGKVARLPENVKSGESTVKQPVSFIRSGNVASSGDSYSVLEGLYCEAALKDVAKAVTDKMGNVPVRAIPQVPPKPKVAVGSSGKGANAPKTGTGPTPSKADAKPTASTPKGNTSKTPNNSSPKVGNNKSAATPKNQGGGGKTPVNKNPTKIVEKKPK